MTDDTKFEENTMIDGFWSGWHGDQRHLEILKEFLEEYTGTDSYEDHLENY